jgi:hypothetical protein
VTDLLEVHIPLSSYCVLTWQREKEKEREIISYVSLLITTLIPFMRVPPHDQLFNYFLQGSNSKYYHIRPSTYKFEGNTNFQFINDMI